MWIEYHAGDCNNLNLQWIYVHNWGKYNTLFVLRLLILSAKRKKKDEYILRLEREDKNLKSLDSPVWSCIQAQGADISRRPFWSANRIIKSQRLRRKRTVICFFWYCILIYKPLVAQCLPAFFHQREIFQVLFWYPTKSQRYTTLLLPKEKKDTQETGLDCSWCNVLSRITKAMPSFVCLHCLANNNNRRK